MTDTIIVTNKPMNVLRIDAGMSSLQSMPIPFYSPLDEFLNLNYKLYRETEIKIEDTEIINGYKLYNQSVDCIDYDWFLKLVKLYNCKKEWTYDEWKKTMYNNSCNYWHTMDKYGNSGYYLTLCPEEKKECFEEKRKICFEENCQAMWVLPFPKSLLL